jgi:hypothetical protein
MMILFTVIMNMEREMVIDFLKNGVKGFLGMRKK